MGHALHTIKGIGAGVHVEVLCVLDLTLPLLLLQAALWDRCHLILRDIHREGPGVP